MESNTIAKVMETEEEAKAIAKSYQDKKKQAKADNQQAIEDYRKQAQDKLAAYKEDLANDQAATLKQFQEEEASQQQSEMAEIETAFKDKQDSIVDYIVGEVTKVYGNR